MQKVRVRFAPSPTGMMHLGNVRAALINFLFAHQKSGTFVLRIEDTDAQRMFDPEAQKIIEDLHWLGLSYNEGPHVGGPYAPYYQSARTNLYQEQLAIFEAKKLIYRCFCTEQELEKTRLRQQALKLPPRYDRTCMALTPAEIEHSLAEQTPYIWRFKCDHNLSLTITDFAYGNITFDMSNFSDFAITRQDGSFTFIFANFVDDLPDGYHSYFSRSRPSFQYRKPSCSFSCNQCITADILAFTNLSVISKEKNFPNAILVFLCVI